MSDDEQRVILLLERILPNPAVRDAVLHSLADAIITVNRYGPNSWGVNDHLDLQFTWKAMYTPYVWWGINGQTGEVKYHLDNEDVLALSEEDRELLIKEAKLDSKDPDWVEAYLCVTRQDKVADLVKRLFESYIKKHIGSKPNKTLAVSKQTTHRRVGAATIEYLRGYLKRPEIPQPLWYDTSRTSTGHNQGSDNNNGSTPMPIFDMINKYLQDGGYHFTPTQIASFYTALQTKGFVILSGISGTGKTKLAQEFARLLPQPVVYSVIPDNIIRIKVKPYMHEYQRMIIPQASVKLFTPPDPGKSITVELEFDGKKESCLLSRAEDRNLVVLLLRGNVRTWFDNKFPVDSEIGLKPQPDADGNLSGFKLDKPENFAKTVAVSPNDDLQNHLFLSVRPDWRDSKSLLGYYNPLTKTYQTTPFVEFLVKAKQSYEKKDGLAWFLILDEMNLARVEYYFADLLSVLESGRDDDGYTIEALRFDCGDVEDDAEALPEAIHLPPNLYIVGTVNVDETTQSFSPKVLDRAFSIEFVDVNLKAYNLKQSGQPAMPDDGQRKKLLTAFTRAQQFARIDKTVISQFSHLDEFKQHLVDLNDNLQPSNHHFGYRVFDEIMMFLKNAEENGMFGDDLQAAFDQAVLMKVLPKFHGSRGKLEKPLHALLRWCAGVGNDDTEPVKSALANPEQPIVGGAWQCPATAKRALRMIQSLNTTGFASFG